MPSMILPIETTRRIWSKYTLPEWFVFFFNEVSGFKKNMSRSHEVCEVQGWLLRVLIFVEDKDGPVHQLSMCGDPGI